MAQLNVVAEAINASMYGGGSLDDNRLGAPVIAVSVTAADGTPVTGITDFSVYFLPGATFNPVFIQVSPYMLQEQQPGAYVFGLHPQAAPNTKVKFIYLIKVRRKSDHGQTLTTLETIT